MLWAAGKAGRGRKTCTQRHGGRQTEADRSDCMKRGALRRSRRHAWRSAARDAAPTCLGMRRRASHEAAHGRRSECAEHTQYADDIHWRTERVFPVPGLSAVCRVAPIARDCDPHVKGQGAAMGLNCLTCGKRFYLPPGEQRWLEKRCGGSITQPVRVRRALCCCAPALLFTYASTPCVTLPVTDGVQRVPQHCVSCMERRFSYPLSKENQEMSKDGRVRMPSGGKEDLLTYLREPIEFTGERMQTPIVELSSDFAGIQFQRLKSGETFFGRIREELPRGGLTVYLVKNGDEKMNFPIGQRLSGVTITIEFMTRNCTSFDDAEYTITLDTPFPKKLFSQTSYYIFRSFGTATFTEPMCTNDSIAKLRWRKERDLERMAAVKDDLEQRTRAAQENTIMADVWGPPCKVESLKKNWNVETLTGPQRRLQNNCLNYVNSLVEAAQSHTGALVDHSAAIQEARILAVCMGTHPRCGEVSPLFHFVHEKQQLVQKIVRMAGSSQHMPSWMLDDSTSHHMSVGFQLPVAVCVADYPEDKIVSLRQAKNDRMAADRERLLQLSRGHLVKTPLLPQRDQKSGMLRKMGNSLKNISAHNESGFRLLVPSASCRGQPRPFSDMATQAHTMNASSTAAPGTSPRCPCARRLPRL